MKELYAIAKMKTILGTFYCEFKCLTTAQWIKHNNILPVQTTTTLLNCASHRALDPAVSVSLACATPSCGDRLYRGRARSLSPAWSVPPLCRRGSHPRVYIAHDLGPALRLVDAFPRSATQHSSTPTTYGVAPRSTSLACAVPPMHWGDHFGKST